MTCSITITQADLMDRLERAGGDQASVWKAILDNGLTLSRTHDHQNGPAVFKTLPVLTRHGVVAVRDGSPPAYILTVEFTDDRAFVRFKMLLI